MEEYIYIVEFDELLPDDRSTFGEWTSYRIHQGLPIKPHTAVSQAAILYGAGPPIVGWPG